MKQTYWTIGRIIGLIILLCLLLVMGMCYWQNCREDKGPRFPDNIKAQYKITEVYTGNIYYSDNVTIQGEKTGERVIIMRGYWEVSGGKYVFRDITLPLAERDFGEIKVGSR